MNKSMPGLFNILSVEKEASFPSCINLSLLLTDQVQFISIQSKSLRGSSHPENIHNSFYTYVCHDLKNRFWIFVSSTEPIFFLLTFFRTEWQWISVLGRGLEITTKVSVPQVCLNPNGVGQETHLESSKKLEK